MALAAWIHSPETHHPIMGLKMERNGKWQNCRAHWPESAPVLFFYEIWPEAATGFTYEITAIIFCYICSVLLNFKALSYILSNFIILSIMPSLARTAYKSTFVEQWQRHQRKSSIVNTLKKCACDKALSK